jgi:hypothetical protein
MLQDCVEIAGLKFDFGEIHYDEIYPDGQLG